MSRPILSAVGRLVFEIGGEAAKTWITGVVSEHARRFAERRWGSAMTPVVPEDAVLVDESAVSDTEQEKPSC